MRAEMGTEGVKHRLAVTLGLDTCLNTKKNGVKLISTYPERHSIDSVYVGFTGHKFVIQTQS